MNAAWFDSGYISCVSRGSSWWISGLRQWVRSGRCVSLLFRTSCWMHIVTVVRVFWVFGSLFLRRRCVDNFLLTLKSGVNWSWGEITILGEQTGVVWFPCRPDESRMLNSCPATGGVSLNRCRTVPAFTCYHVPVQTGVVPSWVFLGEWPLRCRPESRERQFGSTGVDRASFR